MVFFDLVEEHKQKARKKKQRTKKRATTLHELWRIKKYV